MIQPAFIHDLKLLAGALRQENFRFILIEHNRRSIYLDIAAWLRENYPNRRQTELVFAKKNYRQISDELAKIENGIILIPDFDWLFQPGNERICVAFNQRRDFFARKPISLICFLQPANFLLVPKKLPDWWSIRSLELTFFDETKEAYMPWMQSAHENDSLGGQSLSEKEAELARLRTQIETADPGNKALLLNLHSQFASICYAIARYDEAWTAWQKSLQFARETQDTVSEEAMLNHLSQVLKVTGKQKTAIEYLKQSLEIAHETSNEAGKAMTLNNIAGIYQMLGDYETALLYLEQSLHIRRKTGDKQGEGTTLNNLGQISHLRGYYETALHYLEQSLHIARETGDKTSEGVVLNNISQIYEVRGDYDAALQYLEQSLRISRETGDAQGIATSLANLAIITFQNRNNPEEALLLLKEAYQIFEQIGSPKLQELKDAIYLIRQQMGEERFWTIWKPDTTK